MSDDPKRLRSRAAPPAVSVPPPPGSPALLGRITTTAGLGPGRYFKMRRYTVAGPEIEGGAGTLTAGPTAPVYVLARGGTPIAGALVVASQVPYRWVWVDTHPDPPCDYNDLCVHALHAGAGKLVTLERGWIDTTVTPNVAHWEAYPLPDGAALDADERYCVRVPITLADPATAPTVDPDGGGTSGGTLAVGAYLASYTWLTHFGETGESPAVPFQVGVPDPNAAPAVVLGVGDTGSRSGLLDAGTYRVLLTYADAGGGTTRAGGLATVRVGVAEPADTLRTEWLVGSGGALAAGTYKVRWALTDGTYHTTPVDEADLSVYAGLIPGLTAKPGVFPAPVAPATGFVVWLSDDAGATWRRYLNDVLPAPDADFGFPTIRFSAAYAGTLGTPAASNTFPLLDPRITVAAMATVRPNAASQQLYIATPTGPFRAYGSPFTGTTADLLDAFPGSGAAPATTNTTAQNIPSVAFTASADSIRARVYARPVASPLLCTRFEATASPRTLIGAPTSAGCPPDRNTTGGGVFRWTVTDSGYTWEDIYGTTYGSDSRSVTVPGRCGTYITEFTCTATVQAVPQGTGAHTVYGFDRVRIAFYDALGALLGSCDSTGTGCTRVVAQNAGDVVTITAQVDHHGESGTEDLGTSYGTTTLTTHCWPFTVTAFITVG